MSHTNGKEDITGLVLAGGRGRRMNSVNKGLQLFQGKPLFLRAANRLLPQVGTLLVNANHDLDRYAQAGFQVIQDEPVTFSGPLAGFTTGLRHCNTPYMVTVPCDSPFFPDTLVSRLLTALMEENADLAIAVTGATAPFSPQPVFCLMKRHVLPHLEAFLLTGQRKIDAWFSSLKVAHAHFADESDFDNINTIEALKNAEEQLNQLNKTL